MLHSLTEEVRMKVIRTRNILVVISLLLIGISLAVIAFRPVVKDIRSFIRSQSSVLGKPTPLPRSAPSRFDK